MINTHKELALVTGASSGLGRSISLKLAIENFHVILSSRNLEILNSVKYCIESNSGDCTVIPLDVGDEHSVQDLENTCKKIGFVSVVINNSGIGLFIKIEYNSTEDWDRMINMNLRGAFLISRAFIPQMHEHNRGTLVFMNSVAGKYGYPFSAGYVASKFGLRGFAESLRNELRKFNIKVTSVHPGAVNSPFWENTNANFPRNEMMQDNEVADMIVHAITFPGIAVAEEIVVRRVKGDF